MKQHTRYDFHYAWWTRILRIIWMAQRQWNLLWRNSFGHALQYFQSHRILSQQASIYVWAITQKYRPCLAWRIIINGLYYSLSFIGIEHDMMADKAVQVAIETATPFISRRPVKQYFLTCQQLIIPVKISCLSIVKLRHRPATIWRY